MRKHGVLFGIGTSVLMASAVLAAELPQGFRLEPFVSGLTEPTDVEDTPDGLILITERTTGDLRHVRWGELQATPLCSVAVNSASDRGLLGVAVHPDYGRNGWIYLYYTSLASGNNKVTRYTIRDGGCQSPLDILPNLGVGGIGRRNGGGIDFGPDGKLYVATGDMEVSGNGQSLAALQGKVLRLDDDGSIPSDNPIAGSAIYTVGVRDPRGLAVNGAGTVYATDRGDFTVYDEVDIAQEDGNLGWAVGSGSAPAFDDPLQSWLPIKGVHGVTDYDGALFPDADTDAEDNDNDSFGPDLAAGNLQTDDNNVGECIGGANNGGSCSTVIDCLPARTGEATPICEKRDDPAEKCPAVASDDDCDNVGAAGVDEPDESYLLDVFAVKSGSIDRAVFTDGAGTAFSNWETFFDPAALGDCPTNLVGAMSGRDGHLYVIARNAGAGAGALYRVVHDETAGPREVSSPTSYVPLRVGKNGADVDLYWEDLRKDSMQVGDNGSVPTAPVRAYSIWRGEVGSWTSHTAVANGIAGAAVNDVVRTQTFAVTPGEDEYFLVSGRGDNLEGTLGSGAAGERPGYAVTDLCDTIGLYSPPNSSNLFKCTPEIELFDTRGVERRLTELRGRPVWLDFPAEWCGPCHSEANEMEAIYQEFKDRGVIVISVLMDEEANGPDWNGRPTQAECRLWGDRGGTIPDHTFECWADPIHCTGNPCGGGATQEGWPKFNAFGALPTNAIIDQGGRVVWSDAGWSVENFVRNRLNALVGSSDSCLH